MNSEQKQASLSYLQRWLIALFGLVLSVLLFVFRGGLESQNTLDYLARKSIDPSIALSNHTPTLIEFYADWCEVCQSMSPLIASLDAEFHDQIDIVLLNVDNPKWEEYLDKYDVNGIPQINLFDSSATLKGTYIGSKTKEELFSLVSGLISNQSLKKYDKDLKNGVKISFLNKKDNVIDSLSTSIKPTSHG